MARIRTIKPEFWTDERLSELPEAVHMLAAALLNYADDEGFFNANPALVKAACFPLREPSVSIHGGLTELSNIGYLQLFDGIDGRKYGWIVSFSKHQKINRPSPSRIRGLVRFSEDSVNAHGGLSESSLPEQGSGRGTGNREQGTRSGREAEGEGESEGKPFAVNPLPSASLPPLDLSRVDWGWVTTLATRVGRMVPPKDDSDRRQWLKFAVLAWTTYSEDWLADGVEAVLRAKDHRRSRQAHLVGVLKAKAIEGGTDEATWHAMLKRIDLPDEIWKSDVLTTKGTP
jgi:hypothetical protein